MAQVKLYAVPLGEAQGLFGARPDVAERVRAMTADLIAAKPKRRVFFAGGQTRTPVPPQEFEPSQHDVEAMLAGRYPAPDRIVPAWLLLEQALAGISRARHVTPLPDTADPVGSLDFALAAAGVGAEHGLRHLLDASAELPTHAPRRVRVGCVPADHARAMAASWASASLAEGPIRQAVTDLAGWLTAVFGPDGRDSSDLDLLAILHP